MEAETGMVQLLATEHQGLPGATRSREEATRDCLSSLLREQALPILILDFQPPRLWGNKLLGFYITKSVVMCYSRPRKLIYHLIITDDVALYLMTEKDVCDLLSNEKEKRSCYKHRLHLSLAGWLVVFKVPAGRTTLGSKISGGDLTFLPNHRFFSSTYYFF